MSKALLYVNSKGFAVSRHSYSGSTSYNFCPRKYYLERVQGWSDKQDRVARHFGIALEAGVTFWHQHRQDTAGAVAEFQRLWLEHKDKEYIYSKPEKDWTSLGLTGAELLKLYTLIYPTLPYVVNNPQDFQVQGNFEIFPGTKLAGIEFTSYIDLIAQLKGSNEDIIIDIKTSGKDVPDLTMLDPQLRSYAWVKWMPEETQKWVAFLWFRKMGREISKGDKVMFLEPYAGFVPGTSAFVLLKEDFGVWVTPDAKIEDEMNAKFVGASKAVVAAKLEYIKANGKHVAESAITKQRVQFKMATITKDSADDIGRKIKHDVVNIARANETEDWSMNSGVRFPDERCPNCAMRGICSNQPELRDALVSRKQLEEIDFGTEAE